MRSTLYAIIAALLVGCATTPDPIDRFVAGLDTSFGWWQNGIFPVLDLPQTASPEQVIKRIFEMTGFDKGQVTSYKILKMRQVHIGGDLYTASLVQINFGEKIVLFKYDGPAVGWWSRVYDAKTSG